MGLTHDIWARCGKGLFLLKGGTPPVGRLFGSWQSPAVSCRGRISAALVGKQLWIDDPPLLGWPDAAGYETMRPKSFDTRPPDGRLAGSLVPGYESVLGPRVHVI